MPAVSAQFLTRWILSCIDMGEVASSIPHMCKTSAGFPDVDGRPGPKLKSLMLFLRRDRNFTAPFLLFTQF